MSQVNLWDMVQSAYNLDQTVIQCVIILLRCLLQDGQRSTAVEFRIPKEIAQTCELDIPVSLHRSRLGDLVRLTEPLYMPSTLTIGSYGGFAAAIWACN